MKFPIKYNLVMITRSGSTDKITPTKFLEKKTQVEGTLKDQQYSLVDDYGIP